MYHWNKTILLNCKSFFNSSSVIFVFSAFDFCTASLQCWALNRLVCSLVYFRFSLFSIFQANFWFQLLRLADLMLLYIRCDRNLGFWTAGWILPGIWRSRLMLWEVIMRFFKLFSRQMTQKMNTAWSFYLGEIVAYAIVLHYFKRLAGHWQLRAPSHEHAARLKCHFTPGWWGQMRATYLRWERCVQWKGRRVDR